MLKENQDLLTNSQQNEQVLRLRVEALERQVQDLRKERDTLAADYNQDLIHQYREGSQTEKSSSRENESKVGGDLGKIPETYRSHENIKDCEGTVDIGKWPSISDFESWQLRFKKKVAASSRRPKRAFTWILL